MKLPLWLRLGRGLLVGGGIVLALSTFSAIGMVLHASLPAGRQVVAQLLTGFLSDYFQGTVEVTKLTDLGLRGLTAERVLVYDTYGNRVLALSELRARASLRDIAKKLLSGEERISLVIHHVRLERGEAQIVVDPKTKLPTIAAALTPTPSADATPSSRYVRVWLPMIEVGAAFGRGQIYEDGPTLEADLSTIRGSVLVTPKGTAVDVVRFALKLRGLGGVDAQGLASLHVREPGPIWGYFDGYFGELQTAGFVRWQDDQLSVRVDVPQAAPEAVRAVWPVYPLQENVAFRAKASGPLSSMDTELELKVRDAVVTARGPLSLVGDPGIELAATGRSIDLRALWPVLPPTAIDARAAVSIWQSEQQVRVDFNGYTEPSSIGEHLLPALDIQGSYDELGLVSRTTVHEPGLPAKVSFDIDTRGVVHLELDAKRLRLDHPRLAPYFRARGLLEGQLKTRIEGDELRGTFAADVQNLRVSEIALDRAHVEGKLVGNIDKLDALQIEAALTGRGLHRDELAFQHVTATASGSLSRPQVKATLENPGGHRLAASGSVVTRGEPRVDNLSVQVENQGATLSIDAARISGGDGGLKIDNLRVKDGASELTSDIEVLRDGLRVKAKGRDVNLDTISQALGLGRAGLSGRLTIDADIVSTERAQQGWVDLRFQDLEVEGVTGVSGQAHAAFDDGRLVGQAELQVAELGALGAAVDLKLEGRLDEMEVWRKVTGSGRVELYAVNLEYFKRYLKEEWGIVDLRGLCTARVRFERDDPTAVPSTMFDAQTHGLLVELASSEASEPALSNAPERQGTLIQGIDLQFGGTLHGPSGQSSGSIRAVDAEGPLASASVAAALDLEQLWEQPQSYVSVLRKTPIDTVFVLPARKLEELPPLIRPPGVEGVVSGRLALAGPPDALVLSGLFDVERLRGTATALAKPISAKARFNYAASSGEFGSSIEAESNGQRILWGHFSGSAPLAGLFETPPGTPRWTGSGTLSLDDLPLDLFQPLSQAKVAGRLRGIIAVSRREDLPDFNAQLHLSEARIQDIDLGDGQLIAKAGSESVSGQIRFGDDRGELKLALTTKIGRTWRDEMWGEHPIVVDLESNNYDAVLLLPFVEDLFSELSGSLDANVHAELFRVDDAKQSADPALSSWDARFSGHARLRQGVVKPAALGLELRETTLRLVASREGEYNVVEIYELGANARSDDRNISGNGKFYFKGLAFSHGWAGAGLDDVPFVVGGVRLADLTGQVGASIRRDQDRMSTVVEIPRMRIMLPRSTGRSLIDLNPNPNIVVLQPLGPREEDEASRLPWYAEIRLGDDVRVQSAVLNIQLAGAPEIIFADELNVDGKLLLPAGGRVVVAGKLFVIEHGFIQFDTEDFSDPHLHVQAVWNSPGGIRVTANLSGTAREPELTLSSDPALPGGEAEIYALLFGGGAGDTESNAASPALGAGATVLSEVLGNTALRGVELRAGVEKRQSSGQSAQLADDEWRSYAAAVPLSDDVWFEGSYKTEQRATAAEGRSGFSGTIDWRFRKNWALRTELGQLGTGMDLLWNYRY